MQESNPYSAPQTDLSLSERFGARRLLTAYFVAPFFAPLTGALVTAAVGWFYQIYFPDDPNFDPLSLFLGPFCTMIIGVPISYAVAGVVGTPSVLWLRQRNQLNLTSILLIGVLCATVPGCLLTLLGMSTVALRISPPSEIGSILLSGFVAFLVVTPFALLSASIFWWIGVRQPKRRPAKAVDQDESIIA
ncbi:MAG: hypothetical protein AAGG48_30705 [Planctomycetota bacterium]